MNWESWVVIVVLALMACGLIGVKIYDYRQWKMQVENARREFEQMKTRYADTQRWVTNAIFDIDKKTDRCAEDIAEVSKFAHGLETELYDTYDTLEAMINGSEDKGEE